MWRVQCVRVQCGGYSVWRVGAACGEYSVEGAVWRVQCVRVQCGGYSVWRVQCGGCSVEGAVCEGAVWRVQCVVIKFLLGR